MSFLINSFKVSPAAGAGYGSHRYWRIFVTANGGGANTFIDEIEFHSTIGGADITGSGTALSGGSGSDSFGPANAFDNSAATANDGWQRSSATNTYVGYDFGSAVTVAEFTIRAHNNSGVINYLPQSFTLDWSDDGSSWTTADSFTAYGWILQQVRTYPETAPATGYHRFWRINITAGTGAGPGIVEAELRATSGGADQTANLGSDSTSTTARAITNSSSNPISAWRVFDGDTTNLNWSTLLPGYVGYIFSTPTAVQEVTIKVGTNTAAWPTSFTIDHSDDGSSWTTDRTVTGASWVANETKTYSVP